MKRLRAYYIEVLLAGTLLVAVAFFGYLGYGLLRPQVINEPFSGEKALANVGKQLEFGPRITGTDSSVKMSAWLVEQLRLLGWDVIIQPFTVQETVTARNIVAVRSHSRPGSPVAMLVTPYDTRLVADADPTETNRNKASLGANSGASGAAVLLELARTLDVEVTGHTVCLAFLDAEHNGGLPGWEAGLGSKTLAESLTTSVPRCAAPRFVLSLDEVGAADQRFYQDEAGEPALQRSLWQAAANLDYGRWFQTEPRPLPPGSQTAFQAQAIPTTSLAGSDYPYLDTLQDTIDKLSAETLQRVGAALKVWLETQP